jgi:hypothetical protein
MTSSTLCSSMVVLYSTVRLLYETYLFEASGYFFSEVGIMEAAVDTVKFLKHQVSTTCGRSAVKCASCQFNGFNDLIIHKYPKSEAKHMSHCRLRCFN